MADTPEKKMKKKVDALLEEYGIWFFAPQSGIYGRAGIPDRIGILPGGRMIAIEVKAPEAKRGLTALQEKTISEMALAGALTWVVYNDNDLIGLKAYFRLNGVNPVC